MLSIVLRRLALLIPVLFGVSIVTFGLITLTPSDPAEVAIRVNAMVPTEELLAEVRAELGLDQPLFTRYLNWLGAALQGDFGKSWVTGRPVTLDFAETIPATLELALATLAIILVVSMICGVICALNENGPADALVRGIVFVTSSMPGFWAGLLLMWLFAVELELLPTSGRTEPGSIILPACTLALAYIGTYVRLVRSAMIETGHENWVVFARARGLSDARVTAHVLLNSLRASATALGISIPKLAAGAFVVENIFAWPGVGRLCVTAIFNRDFPIIEAYVLIMALLFAVFSMASDVFIAWLDPRERQAQ